MATIILGQHADALTVRLTEGDGAELAATLVDSTGTEVDWTAAPTLSFAHSVTRDVIAEHTATIAGPVATWELTRADIDDIATGSLPRRAGQLYTYARITTPDTGDTDGHVEYAGKVDWRDGWTAGDRSQRVTFTLPGVPGPPGIGSGADLITIVTGGTVTLDDDMAEGTLLGYRVKDDTQFSSLSGEAILEPGAYSFERTETGWTYYKVTGGTVLQTSTDAVSPVAGTLTATGGSEQVTLTVSGASDDLALAAAPYAFSTDGGSTWAAWQASPTATITGLAPGAITCRHRVRDTTGNVSLGATKAATVTAPSSWTTRFRDTFTAADNTLIAGHSMDAGGLTWVKGYPWLGPDSSLGAVKITGNRYRDDRVNDATPSWHYVDFAANDMPKSRLTAVYDLTPVGSGYNGTLMLRFINGAGYSLTIDSTTATLAFGDGATGSAVGVPLAGTLIAEADGTALTVKVDGATVGTATLSAPLAPASFAIRTVSGTAGHDPNNLHTWPAVDEVHLEVIA